MDVLDTKKRFLAAYKLLSEQSTTFDKFESVKNLIYGFNPKVDKILNSCSETLSKIEKLQRGEVIELTAEHLPQQTDEDKKRKRLLLLFIRSWKDLKSEIERIRTELDSGEHKSLEQRVQMGAKIISFAKGPFGMVTIVALVALILVGTFSQAIPTEVKTKTQVITFNDKKIPLSELATGVGPECLSNGNQATHYHAKDHEAVKAIDGTRVLDPGGCGFGRVDEVRIEEI